MMLESPFRFRVLWSALACVVGTLCGAPGVYASEPLVSVAYWRNAAGCWASENSYFNSAMAYNIKSYASLLCIQLEGEKMLETEIKFYPAGPMASGYGGVLVGAGEGVEVENIAEGVAIDANGGVRLTRVLPVFGAGTDTTEIMPVSADTALRDSREAGAGHDSYRMLMVMPAKDRRYRLNLGLVSAATTTQDIGDLRGFSIFRERRIGPEDVSAMRAALRARFNVGVTVRAGDDGKPVARRVD